MSTIKSSAEDLILNADGASSEVKIQQNGTTAITIDSSENVKFAGLIDEIVGAYCKLRIRDDGIADYITLDSRKLTSSGNGGIRFTGTDSSGNTSERFRITPDGRGLSQFTAKAWCKADMGGSSGHTPTITNSHNISSFTDHGVGNVELSFTNSIAANATAVWAVDLTQNLGDVVTVTNYYSSPGTTSCRARVFDHSANLSDSDALHVQVFGD